MPLLLPATRIGQSLTSAERERATWSEQADRNGLVPQSPQQVISNLVAPEVIQPAGVSAPLAPAKAFRWRLEAPDDKKTYIQATQELRLLLVAQFVGLVDQVPYRLTESRLLPRVLRADANLDEMLLWVPKTPVRTLPSVIAATLLPAYPLFPSAAIQTKSGRNALREWLVTTSGGQIVAAGDDVQFADAAQAHAFQAAVVDLLRQPTKVAANSAWRHPLQRLAGPSVAEPTRPPVEHRGLIAPYAAHDHWLCEHCERQGKSWSDAFANVTTVIDASADGVYCATHKTPLLVGDRAVTLSDLGAARSVVYEQGAAIPKLFIWTDIDLGRRFVPKATTQNMVQLWYLQTGGPILELRGHALKLADVQTATSPVPRGELRCTHTIPIASRYLHLLDERTEWHDAEGSWEIWLKGRPIAARSQPPADPAPASDGVVVWPREEFLRAGKAAWSRQIVGAFFKFSDAAALVTARPTAQSADAYEVGAFEPLPYLSAATAGTQVRYLVLATKNVHGVVERGAIPLRPRTSLTVQEARTGWIALDFGTANTTALFGLESPTEPVSVMDGVANPGDSCFFPGHGSGFIREMEETLSLFSSWYAPASGPKPMLGTLLFRESTRHAVVPAHLVKNIAPEAKAKMLGNLKWQGLATYDGSAVEAYLERVLLPAFQAIVAAGATKYHFVATYPLAFNLERKLRFQSALTKVLKTIDTATGLEQLGLQLISESHAGIHAVAALQAPYSLTIDMGGGTTDFALIKGSPSGTPRVLLAESLRVGGRDLIRAALHDQQNVEQELAKAYEATRGLSVSSEVAIEGLLGVKDVDVRILMGQPSVNRRQRIAALLSGIVVATVRLVLAALSHDEQRDNPPSINVILLGQGWHLLHGELLPRPFTEAFFLQALGKRGDAINFQQVTPSASASERKLQLVRGALRLAAKHDTDDSSSAMSFMGLDLRLSNGAQVDRAEPLGAVPNVRYADGDPGVADLVDDLVETMRLFDSKQATIGDVDARLADVDHGLSTLDRLIRHGNRDLLACQENAQIIRSPLMAIIEDTWLPFWSPRGE